MFNAEYEKRKNAYYRALLDSISLAKHIHNIDPFPTPFMESTMTFALSRSEMIVRIRMLEEENNRLNTSLGEHEGIIRDLRHELKCQDELLGKNMVLKGELIAANERQMKTINILREELRLARMDQEMATDAPAAVDDAFKEPVAHPTTHLRFVNGRLQQLWQDDRGNEQWEMVESCMT